MKFALFLLCAAAFGQKFEVASVKASPTGARPSSNMPLGPGDAFSPTGGSFSATGTPLAAYIYFAYKATGPDLAALREQLPAWALTDPYDIQAKASGNPGKDDFRVMMRALLADRFQLKLHEETREIPVAALVVSNQGKLGPQLQQHPADDPCPLSAPPSETVADGKFPLLCGGLVNLPPSAPGRFRFAARNVTLDFLAKQLSAGTASGRPLVDRTGLSGKFDFNIEFVVEGRGPVDETAPTFEEALRAQLGLKVVSQKAPVTVLRVDRVERPSGN